MKAPATTAMTANTPSLTRIDLGRCMSAPLVEVVRSNQWVARGVRAGHLPDGATPLQLKFRQIALESRSSEEGAVQAAQRQIDDDAQVGVVATNPFLQRFVRERIRRKQTQRPSEGRASVGQRTKEGRNR